MNLLLIKRLKSWSSLSIPISRARASLRSLDALGYCQPLHSQAKPQQVDCSDQEKDDIEVFEEHKFGCDKCLRTFVSKSHLRLHEEVAHKTYTEVSSDEDGQGNAS